MLTRLSCRLGDGECIKTRSMPSAPSDLPLGQSKDSLLKAAHNPAIHQSRDHSRAKAARSVIQLTIVETSSTRRVALIRIFNGIRLKVRAN